MAVMPHLPLPADMHQPVTFKESVGLLNRTGHGVSKNTLIRWAREKGYTIERVAGTDYISYSDLLEVHAEKTWEKLRGQGA